MKSQLTILGIIAAVTGFGTATAMAQNPEELPRIEGKWNYPVDINNSGLIVGNTFDKTNYKARAVVWKDGVPSLLPGYDSNGVFAVNDSGVIAGEGVLASGGTVPVLWKDGVATELPTLGNGGRVFDINNAGVAVGYVRLGFQDIPAVWNNGVLSVLTSLFDLGGQARSIDSAGMISGYSTSATGSLSGVPTQWVGGVPTGLPVNFGTNFEGVLEIGKSGAGLTAGYVIQNQPLPNGANNFVIVAVGWQNGEYREFQRPYGIGKSVARGVNDAGIFVGQTEDLDGYTVPTMWNSEGAMRLPLEFGRSAVAVAINESGTIVGYDNTDSSNPVPVLWKMNALRAVQMSSMEANAGSVITISAVAKRGAMVLPNQMVEFRMNNMRIGMVRTDAKGVAKVLYRVPTLASGNMQIMASLGGSSYVFRSLTVGKSTVVAGVTSAKVAKNQQVQLKATLKMSDRNAPVANKQVSFLVGNQVVAQAVTNAKGVAVASYKRPMNTIQGSRPVSVQYAGDSKTKSAVGRNLLMFTK